MRGSVSRSSMARVSVSTTSSRPKRANDEVISLFIKTNISSSLSWLLPRPLKYPGKRSESILSTSLLAPSREGSIGEAGLKYSHFFSSASESAAVIASNFCS